MSLSVSAFICRHGRVRTRPETSIDRRDFLRIQPGMSRTDVVRILGVPGDYREARYLIGWHEWTTDAWGKMADERCVWYANLATIQISFGPDDKAEAGACFVPQGLNLNRSNERAPGFGDHLREFFTWLGLF